MTPNVNPFFAPQEIIIRPQNETQEKLMQKQIKEIEILAGLQKQELEQLNEGITKVNIHQWNQLMGMHKQQLNYPHNPHRVFHQQFDQCQNLVTDQQKVQKREGDQLWQKHVQEGQQLQEVHLNEMKKLLAEQVQEKLQQIEPKPVEKPVKKLVIKKSNKQIKALQDENARPLQVYNKLPENVKIKSQSFPQAPLQAIALTKNTSKLNKLTTAEKFAALKKTFPSVGALNNCLDKKIVNLTDENGNTLLHLAVENISREFYKIDIHKLGDIDRVNHEGNTALHIACEKRDWVIVKFLLKSGADDHIKNNKDLTPFNLMGRNVPIDVLQAFGKANAHREKRKADSELIITDKRIKF